MKLVTFQTNTEFGPLRRVGAVHQDRIVDLLIAYLASLEDQSVDPRESHRIATATLGSSMEDLIANGSSALEAASAALDFAAARDPSDVRGPGGSPGIHDVRAVKLLPPLQPASLRDFIAFEDHARAGAKRRNEDLNPIWFERPIYYKGNHRSIIGPDDDLQVPSFTSELDFEMEVACIIGASGIDIGESEAPRYIFGFTIMNDWSARDVQRAEMAARLGPAKSKDFATSLGPAIVTSDETGPHPKLSMTARLNGTEVCRANSKDAHWTFPKLISYVSEGESIHPGDVYGSGTPFGGCLLDRGGPYLGPGDVVEIEVETIGTLTNRIV